MIEKLQRKLKSLGEKTGCGRFEAGIIICNIIKNKKESVRKQVWSNYETRQENI